MATELIPSERDEETALAIIQSLEQVRAMIPTKDLSEVLQLHEQADLVKAWASRHERYKPAAVQLSDIALRAARRAGELLRENPPQAGARGIGKKVKCPNGISLSDIGITAKKSSAWQKIASVDEKEFEKYIAARVKEQEPCRASEVVRLAKIIRKSKKRKAREERAAESGIEPPCTVDDLNEASTKYQTVYADPPWKYGNQGTRAATDDHYGTMSVEEICALPIREIVADKAVLWLWTTNGFLFESKAVIEAWGFEYKSCMVWCKTQMGIGNYVRVSHEFLMIGSRGKCRPDGKSTKSWLECDRKKHSAKPDEFRTIIERISPEPRIELFAREARPGWTAWGNEIERQKFLEAANV